MSERNGDKARFQKNRQRKLHQRQQVRALMSRLAPKPAGESSAANTRAASVAIQNEGGPTGAND